MKDMKKQGKRNKAAGQRFELKVRKDLESKNWIVSKWMNQVMFHTENSITAPEEFGEPFGKLIPAKHKFQGLGRPMAIGTGFPDFVCFKVHDLPTPQTYLLKFVEAKSNGYLDKKEKQKLTWLRNQGFNIEIAKKGKKRGSIEYVGFKTEEEKDVK